MQAHRPRPSLAAVLAPALATVLLLAACSDGGTATPTTPPGPETAPPRPTVAPDSVPVQADVDGVAAFLEVGPVVRDGELAVLHVRVTGNHPERSVESADLGLPDLEPGSTAPNHIRLLDAAALEVRPTAHTADGARVAAASTAEAAAGETMTLTAVYAAPSGDTTAVLLPTVGLVDRVPVVDAADAPEALPALDELLGEHGVTAADLEAPVVPAESSTTPVADDAGEGEGATVTVGPVEEGVTLSVPATGDAPAREVHVAVDEVRRLDGVLVGTVRATLRSGEPASIADLVGPALALHHEGELVGPLTHAVAGPDGEVRLPLADQTLDRTLQSGESLRVTVVWPDVDADVATVTVAHPGRAVGGAAEDGDDEAAADDAGAWRVTDVPVWTV